MAELGAPLLPEELGVALAAREPLGGLALVVAGVTPGAARVYRGPDDRVVIRGT